MKKICLFYLIFCILLTASGCKHGPEPLPGQTTSGPAISAPEVTEPEPSAPEESEPETTTVLGVELTEELSERERNWLEDLDVLRRDYERYHAKPFYRLPRDEFERRLSQLAAKVGELSDSDIFFEIEAILSAMDDGVHTSAIMPESIADAHFPVNVQYFGDKLYLVDYLEEYEQFAPYLLHEIVAVNGIDITYIQKKFESVLSPNNSWFSKEHFAYELFIPAFMDWVGCDYKEGYSFQFLDDDQRVQSVEVPIISLEELYSRGDPKAVYPEGGFPNPFQNDEAKYIEGESGGCVYIRFSQMETLREEVYQELFETAAEEIQAHPECSKLAIDIRFHPGGDTLSFEIMCKFISLLKAPSIEDTYVLTGGYTTSAATMCMELFKEELDAVLVGEPTGQFTSFYAFMVASPIVLPHSEISIWIANRWFGLDDHLSRYDWSEKAAIVEEYYDESGNLYEWENTILPDVFVYQDIEDIRQGKDSVIEWVLAQ